MKKKKVPAIWSVLDTKMRPMVRYWLPAAAVEEEDLRLENVLLKIVYCTSKKGSKVLATLVPPFVPAQVAWYAAGTCKSSGIAY